MIDHGCGVSHYSQFYGQKEEKFKILPRPYLGSFERNKGEILQKEIVIRV